MDSHRGAREPRRRGRNWRNTSEKNGPSRLGNAARQAKSSRYFLPQELQEANPWDETDNSRDYMPSDGDRYREGHSSHYERSCDDDYNYSRHSDNHNNYDRSNRRLGRMYDESRAGRVYNSSRSHDRDHGSMHWCGDRNGRDRQRNRECENAYDRGDRNQQKNNRSWSEEYSDDRDDEYGYSRQYDDREQYHGDGRESFSRRNHSPERLTREEWRRLEREEWLREQEREQRQANSRGDHSRPHLYGNEHDFGERPQRDFYRGNRGQNHNYEESKSSSRRGRQRGGGARCNGSFGGTRNFKFDSRQSAEAFSFGSNGRDEAKNDSGSSIQKDDMELNERNSVAKSLEEVLMEMRCDQDTPFGEKAVNVSELTSREDAVADVEEAINQLSVRDERNSTTNKNSDTESEGDQRSHQEEGSERNSVSTVTESSVAPMEEVSAIILAPKKSPASRKGKLKVSLLTNFWELSVQNKVVYRYDVTVYLGTPTNDRAIDLLRGPRDDSALTARHRLCMDALRYALEFYRILREGSAIIHDGAAMMFSSEDLSAALKEHRGVLTLDIAILPAAIRALICRVDVNKVTIEIMPCKTAAASFDLADLSAQKSRNWASLDRSWKQFYDLITNQDAVISGHFTQFGAGCLYYSSPLPERVGFGYERFAGARKGIKFIEGKKQDSDNVVAALILDHRVGMFFKNQNLMASICELRGMRNVDKFDFSLNNRKHMNKHWSEVNQYVKGLRLKFLGAINNPISFVAAGISNVPIKDLEDTLPNNARTKISVLKKFSDSKFRINPFWPAVKSRNDKYVQYFPMELLEVAPNQRVSLEKQQMVNSVSRADKPDIRMQKIYSLLEALNLHDSGAKNQFLNAFGIKIAYAPKRIEGFRREPPSVAFGNDRPTVDKVKCSWRQERTTKYVSSARVKRVIIVHSDKTEKLPKNVESALSSMFKDRGIQCGKFDRIRISNGKEEFMENELLRVFEENKGEDSLLIIYIDRAENRSHEYLKLLERRFLIPTQQITAELAEKIQQQRQSCGNFVSKTNLKLGGINYEVVPESFARNRWIAGGKTMVVGYDVAHPGKPTRDEVMNRMPPMKPSVVGFAFNGAFHPEAFIGDYHFQTPRRERIDDIVLNARFKWMLGLFKENRGEWPESVVITRDGVSEGQYRMVVEEELGAIKEACEEFGNLNGREGWKPLFTVVVATKRHNARFFSERGGRFENPQPATVVDTDVVRSDITEFFMQSHRPVQGTAKPTSYQVIVDENDMSSDEVQSLMLALSFHHQIVDSPISIPEPVYQADEWAKRGKDIWKAYTDRYNLLRKNDKGEYSDFPVDFEAMTKRLAYWSTNLQMYRVNA